MKIETLVCTGQDGACWPWAKALTVGMECSQLDVRDINEIELMKLGDWLDIRNEEGWREDDSEGLNLHKMQRKWWMYQAGTLRRRGRSGERWRLQPWIPCAWRPWADRHRDNRRPTQAATTHTTCLHTQENPVGQQLLSFCDQVSLSPLPPATTQQAWNSDLSAWNTKCHFSERLLRSPQCCYMLHISSFSIFLAIFTLVTPHLFV